MNTSNSLRSNTQNNKSSNYDQDSWREKYFSALEDQENDKNEANSTIDVLRRGLLSVSLAGDGLDLALDSKLSKLRSLLKTARDYPVISELLQTIETDLIRLDTEKAAASQKQKQHTSDALALLLKSSIDAEIKNELKEFQKKIKASNQGKDLARQFESELIDLLLPLLSELCSDYADKNPAEGLWGRFKKSVAAPEKVPEADSASVAQTKVKDNSAPIGYSSAGGELKDRSEIDSELFKQTKLFIIKLIKQLYDNVTLTDVAKLLSADISNADSNALLARYPKILNLVELGRTQDKKAFLDYLGEINYSLSKLNSSIAKGGEIAKEIKTSKRKQNKRLRGGVEKIRSILDTAKDLESAKSKTQETLDEIVENIEASAEIDNKSQAQFEELQSAQQRELTRIENKANRAAKSFDLSTEERSQPDVDTLTGLKNRDALKRDLELLLAKRKAEQKPLCVCLGDIKGLSLLNEKYGNNAGDKAVELLAREIEKNILPSDFLYYGGDGQFFLTKQNCNQQQAASQVESLNAELAQLPFRFKGDEVKVLLLFVSIQVEDADTEELLIEKVNQAMQAQKDSAAKE